jgi:hypothetical protein
MKIRQAHPLWRIHTHLHSKCSAVSVSERLRQGGSAVWSLVAESQLPALRSATALVFNRGNSTVAATQATPEEWDYAKPFEDIPGPKPLLSSEMPGDFSHTLVTYTTLLTCHVITVKRRACQYVSFLILPNRFWWNLVLGVCTKIVGCIQFWFISVQNKIGTENGCLLGCCAV